MRFYTENRKYYCGIDLHTKTMYVCILNESGEILLHQNIPAKPTPFLKLIADYRDQLVVGVECIFSCTPRAFPTGVLAGGSVRARKHRVSFGPCALYEGHSWR